MNFSDKYLIGITALLSTSFWLCYFITYPETHVHENLHCLGCKLSYSNSTCIFDYNMFDVNNPSTLLCTHIDYSKKTCVNKSIGDKYARILVSLLPYFSFNIYICISLLLVLINLHYNYSILIFVFTYPFLFLSSVLSIFTFSLKDHIHDFKNMSKHIDNWELTNIYFITIMLNAFQCVLFLCIEIKNFPEIFIIYKIKKIIGSNEILKKLFKIFNSKSFDTLEVDNYNIIILLRDNYYDDNNRYKKIYFCFIKTRMILVNILSNYIVSFTFMLLFLFNDCLGINNYYISIIYILNLLIKAYNCFYQSLYIKTSKNYYFYIAEILPIIFINTTAGFYYFYFINFCKLFFILYYVRL
jgi:hypothetical protein